MGHRIIVGKFKYLIDWLNNISFINIFIGLIILAVIAQVLQSLVRYLNLLTKLYRGEMLADITKKYIDKYLHSVLNVVKHIRLDLSDYVNQCPETIRLQIKG